MIKVDMNKSTVIKSILAILLLIILYLIALNGRYSKIEDYFYFDKWTRQILIFNPGTGYLEYIEDK